MKTAEDLINDERQRQISAEGWTIEHDDTHIHGELQKAADCYYEYADDNDYTDKKVHQCWPWDKSWWKPKNRLQDFIRAGALYKAEFERMERKGGLVGPKLTNLRIAITQCKIKIAEILKCQSYAHQQTPIAGSGGEAARFEVENSGRQLLKFETEAHIKDLENPDCTIIVQSGYTTLKETDEYAELIVKILNNGSI